MIFDNMTVKEKIFFYHGCTKFLLEDATKPAKMRKYEGWFHLSRHLVKNFFWVPARVASKENATTRLPTPPSFVEKYCFLRN
jgi:hypothetical protein